MGLFHNDIEEFIDQSTAQTIATFISSHRKAIMNSVNQYKEASQAGVTSVVQWIRGWILETDGRKKERRRRKSSGRQKSIVGFLSLITFHLILVILVSKKLDYI